MNNCRRGFTLIEILLALGMMSVCVVVSIQVFLTMEKRWSGVLQKYDSVDLNNSIANILLNSDLCSCQFNSYTVNTTTANPPPINITALRESCDVSGNVLAQAGQALVGGKSRLIVQSIRLESLRFITNGNYFGQLVVSFAGKPGEIALSTLRSDIAIEVSTNAGTATARPISQCVRPFNPQAPSSCPEGMAMVGPSGTLGSFCIDRNERLGGATRTYAQEEAHCTSIVYNGASAWFCSTDQFPAGCRAGVLNNALDDWEMIGTAQGSNGVVVLGGNGCERSAFKEPAQGPFRCCY